jgi:hypothetical protein
MDKIPSGNLWSHMTVRLVGESRVLNTLLFSFSCDFMDSEEIGTADPQGP